MKVVRQILLIACVALFSLFAHGQQENTLYFMERIPQSHYMNPAQHPDAKWWASGLLVPAYALPMLPPVVPYALYLPMHFDISLPIDLNDVVIYENNQPKRWFLYDTKTQDKFLKDLKRYNYVSSNLSVETFFIGFKQKKNYWTVSLNTHMNVNLSFAK